MRPLHDTKFSLIFNKNLKLRHSSVGWNPVEAQFEPARLNALKLDYFFKSLINIIKTKK
jgi:hypothetical protein